LREGVKICHVVENSGSPPALTGKVLNTLAKHNIVQSLTGPHGGFFIDPGRMKRIRASDIVLPIDGDSMYNSCDLSFTECSNVQPCPMHGKFVKVRSEFKKMLETTTVYDMTIGLKARKKILIRRNGRRGIFRSS
jgi:DNA-binding IscR family transcriptional regulator